MHQNCFSSHFYTSKIIFTDFLFLYAHFFFQIRYVPYLFQLNNFSTSNFVLEEKLETKKKNFYKILNYKIQNMCYS